MIRSLRRQHHFSGENHWLRRRDKSVVATSLFPFRFERMHHYWYVKQITIAYGKKIQNTVMFRYPWHIISYFQIDSAFVKGTYKSFHAPKQAYYKLYVILHCRSFDLLFSIIEYLHIIPLFRSMKFQVTENNK